MHIERHTVNLSAGRSRLDNALLHTVQALAQVGIQFKQFAGVDIRLCKRAFIHQEHIRCFPGRQRCLDLGFIRARGRGSVIRHDLDIRVFFLPLFKSIRHSRRGRLRPSISPAVPIGQGDHFFRCIPRSRGRSGRRRFRPGRLGATGNR